jgi:hypothetical protein
MGGMNSLISPGFFGASLVSFDMDGRGKGGRTEMTHDVDLKDLGHELRWCIDYRHGLPDSRIID